MLVHVGVDGNVSNIHYEIELALEGGAMQEMCDLFLRQVSVKTIFNFEVITSYE